MMNLKIILFLLPFVAVSAMAANEFADNALIEKGFRLPSEFVSNKYAMMKRIPEANYLVDYIIKTNYKIPKDDAMEIATNVIKISACFKIDPWILTALIQKESSFQKDAVSPTNAAGLTQFTSSGFREVNDQLGLRGRSSATDAAVTYFNSQILECVDPNWVNLWTRVALPEADPNFYNLSKEVVKEDIQTAVTYGAILLKTYVAYADIRGSRMETRPSVSETYYMALQIYNGEDGDAKVKYAQSIFNNLRSLYPVPLKFDFLE